MAIGDIGEVIDSLEFDPVAGYYSDIIHVAGNIYAIAYTDSDDHGWLKTVSIAGNGSIGAVIDSLEFDPVWGYLPVIIHIAGNVYAIAYEGGPGYNGWLKTVSIAGNGSIGAVIDSLEFDPAVGSYPDIIHIAGGVYAIAYTGPDY
ncbi:unnamed protein product, partial [marine sediment metagenome]